MSYVWGVAFGKEIGAAKTPRSLSARLVSSVFAFLALILINSYSANLMAFLVQENFLLPIKGVQDPKVCSWFSYHLGFVSHQALLKTYLVAFSRRSVSGGNAKKI